MTITLPDLDLRDEETVVAEVINALPAELSDRNRSTPEVKLIEGIGAFYGALLYQMNQVPQKLLLKLVNLLGIEREAATKATTSLMFTVTTTVTIPKGTRVKTSTSSQAVFFVTDADLTITSPTSFDSVSATAEAPGAAGNVSAGMLTFLDQPIGGVSSVLNAVSASGGQDEEAIDSVIARTPLAARALERAINNEDFGYHAARIDGIARAVALGHNGAVTVHLLAEDLNVSPSPTLQSTTQLDLEERTLPSVVVTISQPAIRLIQLTTVEVYLAAGATTSTVETEIREAMVSAVTAVDIVDTDGLTILNNAWPWGEPLFRNDLIALFDGLSGIRRVGRIFMRYSDNYGSSWSAEAELDMIEAAANGLSNPNFGLLHYDDATITVTAI